MKKALIALGIVFLVFVVVNFPRTKKLVPDEFVGTWETDDVRYADRFLRMTKTTVIFGVGENEIDVYFVSEAKTRVQGDEEVVQMTLTQSAKIASTLSLVHVKEAGESLRLLNQPGIFWHRVQEDELARF